MPRPSMSRYRPSCPDESFAQEADGAVLLPPWARAAVRRAFARSLGAVRSLWRGAQRIAWAPAVLMCGCSSTPAASSDSGSSTKAAALGHVFGEGGGGAPGVAPPSSCLVGAASGNLARCVNSRDCGPGSRCNTALSVPSCELVYCGTPGTLCSSDDVCEQGLRCYQSKCTRCDVCGDRCEVDFDNDPKNCGTCGHAVFSNAHQSCSGGQVTCPDGQTVCGYECADLRTSLSSCGGVWSRRAGARTLRRWGTPLRSGRDRLRIDVLRPSDPPYELRSVWSQGARGSKLREWRAGAVIGGTPLQSEFEALSTGRSEF